MIQKIITFLIINLLSVLISSLLFFGFALSIIFSFGKVLKVNKRTEYPQILRDPSLGKHNFVVANGLKFHYVEKGKGPLVLLVHGFPEFWYTWRNQLRGLKDDMHVVAIDMRGYGESERPVGYLQYGKHHLAKDLSEIITALGYEKAFVVAHDWGAIAAWDFALRYPAKCEKLIILNCPHPVNFQIQAGKNPSQFLKSWYIFFFQCPILPELFLRSNDLALFHKMFRSKASGSPKPGAYSKDDVSAYQYMFQSFDTCRATLHYYRNLFWPFHPNPPTSKVTAPTLIIWGKNDTALGAFLNNGVERFVPNVTISYLDASHFVQNDEPELVTRYIDQFIRNQPIS